MVVVWWSDSKNKERNVGGQDSHEVRYMVVCE